MVPLATNQVVGVDVGGTFTDLILIDQKTGAVQIAKVPSTLDNQAFGVLNALNEANVDLASLSLIVHGTTTTTNAVLERKLSKTGLITTRGFRDVLELGRRTRPQPYGMKGTFLPIIPRNLRLEVTERMDASGEVVTPLDEAEVAAAARQLLAAGCESVVIHFLHPYANPVHEQRAREIVADIWPNAYVTTGHSLLSESREFERGVTAAVNACVQPLLERYINRLSEELANNEYRGDVLVMNGNGGMVSSKFVAREAAKTVMSGPASGVMAAAHTGRTASIENLITYDMGGTSTDVALIRNAQPSVSDEIEIEYAMPIHVPMVDVRTVGAGGGSIARVNSAGLLEVGPESAGALPGPICYGQGGTEPTISDANLVLQRLDASKLNSVESGVSVDSVTDIFALRIGSKLQVSGTEAAAAVIKVANTKMAGAIRMVSISLGADPRDFSLFAFGGAGPLHASSLAKELGIPQILVPCRPGITNALGCVVADLRQDFVNAVNAPLESVDVDSIHSIFARQIAQGQAMLERQNIPLRRTAHTFAVDMQFVGQTHLLRVPLETPTPDRENLRKLFEDAYYKRFRVELAEIKASLVNVRTSVIGERDAIDLTNLINPNNRKASINDARTGVRDVYFEDGWHQTSIYWRDHLPIDFTIDGPAIVEQLDTTILIEPGDRARGDGHGNILIEVGAVS
ncbi:MAG: hydantoinase/oxoprolinase family protein [Pseudomonadota bacterium]